MDIAMLQKTAIDLSTTQSEIFAFADRLARAQEQDNASHETAPAAELKEICGQLRAEIQSLSFRIGSLEDAKSTDNESVPSRYAGEKIGEYEFNPWYYDKHIGELRVSYCSDGGIYVLLPRDEDYQTPRKFTFDGLIELLNLCKSKIEQDEPLPF